MIPDGREHASAIIADELRQMKTRLMAFGSGASTSCSMLYSGK